MAQSLIEPERRRSQVRAMAGKTLRWARRYEPEALRALYAMRRARIVARLQLLAAWHGASVEIDIAPDVRFGRDIDLTVWPGSRNVVRIGPGSTIGDRVLFLLNNGTIEMGDRVEVRRDTVFTMWGGRLELEGENVISWGNVIHCAESIRFERLVLTSEYVTVVDSTHYFTEPDVFFYHNTKTGPIEVGYNTWICSKATLARGARVGRHCIIAGNSVVNGEVPSGQMASGVPAVVVRSVPLPWMTSVVNDAPAAATTKPRRRSSSTRSASTRSRRPAPAAGEGEATPDR